MGRNSLYVVEYQDFDDGPIKVGYSRNPMSRLESLQAGNHCTLSLYFSLEHQRAADVEKLVHRRLDDYRVRGEWFQVDVEYAVAMIECIAAHVPQEKEDHFAFTDISSTNIKRIKERLGLDDSELGAWIARQSGHGIPFTASRVRGWQGPSSRPPVYVRRILTDVYANMILDDPFAKTSTQVTKLDLIHAATPQAQGYE